MVRRKQQQRKPAARKGQSRRDAAKNFAGGRGEENNRTSSTSRRRRGPGRGREQGQQRQQQSSLNPVKVSKSSIHSHWKKEIGGLIRYYINVSSHSNPKHAEEEIERMYYQSGCCVDDTKNLILNALGVTKEIQNNWININMAIEKDGLDVDGLVSDDTLANFPITKDSRGIILSKTQRAGEGPAHSHEHWTNVVIPNWAIGKSFFFQLENHSTINFSCEIILDGHQIARNAPLPGKSNRSVKPDANRYFEAHKWILKPAKRVKFQPGIMDDSQQQQLQTGDSRRVKAEEGIHTRPNTPRYNGIRPNYSGKRVSTEAYPDPTSFGWTFTGSVEASFVEFFDRQTNMGIVKVDWYYTTATVKTVLDHPSTGKNDLFRNTVTPEQFAQIMTNPRVHSGRGYRRSEDRPLDIDVKMEDEFDSLPTEETNGDSSQVDAAMDTGNSSNVGSVADSTTYFAKNEAYDFKTQGHMNRRTEMNKLHQSQEYSKWEEAAKREYAVIHAKFYISVPKRKFGPHPSSNNQGRGRGRGGGENQGRGGRGSGQRRRNLEALPQQAPVIDIKAAENATLGTDFLATGPAQNRMRSNVRMDRIKGLTDDDEWKGSPLFEHKLYYRAEEVISGAGMCAVDNEIDMEDELEDSYVGALRENMPLSDYKTEKISQVKQYNVENKAYNPEEAEELLHNCQKKIRLCDNIDDIDELVKIFYGELVKGEFYGNTKVGPVDIEHV